MASPFQSIEEAEASVETPYNPIIYQIKWDVNKKIYVKKLLTCPKLYGIGKALVISSGKEST